VGSWWAGKIRRTVRYLSGRVSRADRAELERLLTYEQLLLFDSMHRADQVHGLDVLRALRAAGRTEQDLLLAGLFHDAGKGPAVGLLHRVTWSLGQRYGDRIVRLGSRLPWMREGLERMRDHQQHSAELVVVAGCSPLTAALIRAEPPPEDRQLGEALRLADEASG
jgi:hypothetical protein